jgi:cytochrome c553
MSPQMRPAVPAPRSEVRSLNFPFLNVRSLIQSLAGIALVCTAAAAPAADLASAEKLAGERCAACHGKDGNTPIDPSYPRLSGQHEDYLVHALRAYKQDARKNAIMGAQAKTLSRDDIYNLAAYYSRLPGVMSHRR